MGAPTAEEVIADLEAVAKATTIFHEGNKVRANRQQWRHVTGCDEVTTVVLVGMARKALARLDAYRHAMGE